MIASHKASNLPQKHTLLTRLFHHGTAILIALLWALVEVFDKVGAHKALGALFLFWVIARLINALLRPKLAHPTAVYAPTWQSITATLVHWGLYGCMLAMPILGILMSVYAGRAVDIFGLVQIPVFVTPSREMAGFFANLHKDVVFPLMMILIVAHIIGAIYHQFVLKDNLLARMK